MDEFEQFINQKPDIKQLREKHGEISHLLEGDFADKPNTYKFVGGKVASWTLLQGKDKNPTYGRFPVGEFKFGMGEYAEKITVLEGELEAEVDGKSSVAGKYSIITAPANSSAKFVIKRTPVLYLCEYSKGGG